MALFRRKQNDPTALPPELQNYYQAENRERTWVAWALAGGTLIVTVLVVLGLFFGGRFLYRKTRHTNEPTPVAVQTQDKNTTKAPTQSTPANTPSAAGSNSPATSSTPGHVNAPANTPQPTSPTSTSAAINSNLPSTGPGNTLAVFMAVSILGYILHRRYITTR